MWIPFFTDTLLGFDHIRGQTTAVSYHLETGPASGHYCTAVFEGGFWWIFEDGIPPVQYLTVLLEVQEDCCSLWLNCMSHGGAKHVSLIAKESPSCRMKRRCSTSSMTPPSTMNGMSYCSR